MSSGLGFVELGTIFLLILILFGPEELPKLARFIARLIYEMKGIFQRLEKEWNLDHRDDGSSTGKANDDVKNTVSDTIEKSNQIQYSGSDE